MITPAKLWNKTCILYHKPLVHLPLQHSRNAILFDPDYCTCDAAVHNFKYEHFFLLKKEAGIEYEKKKKRCERRQSPCMSLTLPCESYLKY